MNLDSTINPNEMAFYESLSAFWWDKSGPFWPLHRLNELRVASHHARTRGFPIRYEHRTAESMVNSGETFELVFNMEAVEHVADLSAFMESCNHLTMPGGLMFVATINRTWLAWLFAIVGAEYILRWLPKGTHRWGDFRRPFEIEQLLASGGLVPKARSGVAINPLTRSFRLTKNTRVNYMLVASHQGVEL